MKINSGLLFGAVSAKQGEDVEKKFFELTEAMEMKFQNEKDEMEQSHVELNQQKSLSEKVCCS